eukprot:1558202-Alexandrium_andersonii.AAC.1
MCWAVGFRGPALVCPGAAVRGNRNVNIRPRQGVVCLPPAIHAHRGGMLATQESYVWHCHL